MEWIFPIDLNVFLFIFYSQLELNQIKINTIEIPLIELNATKNISKILELKTKTPVSP